MCANLIWSIGGSITSEIKHNVVMLTFEMSQLLWREHNHRVANVKYSGFYIFTPALWHNYVDKAEFLGLHGLK